MKDYWTLPLEKVTFGENDLDVKHALVDSGTSLILVP